MNIVSPMKCSIGPGERVLFQALHRPHRDRICCRIKRLLRWSSRPALDLMQHVKFLPLITSRGCPYRCAYCASRRLFDGFIQRNPEDVIHEIESAVMKYSVSDIALYDDAFLVNARDHALPILGSSGAATSRPAMAHSQWTARGSDNPGSSRGHEKGRI